MYPSRSGQASSGYYDPTHDQSEQPHHDGGASSHANHYSRSSSVSSAGGYQQLPSQQYSSIPSQQAPYSHPHYPEQRQYSFGAPGSAHPVPSQHAQFQQRSSSDGVAYITDQVVPPIVRRTSLPVHTAPRERSMSMSYHQPGPAAATSYSQQQYAHDAHYPHTNAQYPPSSYRASVSNPAPQQHPPQIAQFARPTPTRLNTDGPYHSVESHLSDSPVMSHSPSHARGELGVPNLPQPYLQQNSPVITNPARPHVCDSCGLSFVRGHDLKRHKDTHSNAKPHICDCGKSFSRKDALKRHIFLKSCRGKESINGYATSED
jgi:hypothetical protein